MKGSTLVKDSSPSETWDYYIHLMDVQHTAPTEEKRESARREKLNIEITAAHRQRQRWLTRLTEATS